MICNVVSKKGELMANGDFQAKDYVAVGPGFGNLTYNGEIVGIIGELNDQGQQPVGNAQTVRGIGDALPLGAITPLAVQPGKLTFKIYVKRGEGLFGSILNGKFAGATNLAELFNMQLADGPVQLMYQMVQVEGATNYAISYSGVVFTSVVRSFNIQANSSVAQVEFSCEALYMSAVDTQN